MTPGPAASTLPRIGHWIDGQLTAGDSVRTASVFDPARGVQTDRVLLAEPSDVTRAVASATAAVRRVVADVGDPPSEGAVRVP